MALENRDGSNLFRETLREIRNGQQRQALETPPETRADEVEVELEREIQGMPAQVELERGVATREAKDEHQVKDIRTSLGLAEVEPRLAEEDFVAEIGQDTEGELNRISSEIYELTSEELNNPEKTEQATERLSTQLLQAIFRIALEKKLDPKITQFVDSLHVIEPLIEEAISKSGRAFQETDFAQNLKAIFEKIKSQVPGEYWEEVEQELRSLQAQPEISRLKKIGSVGLDFIPVIGPGKMLVEAYKGRTLDGTRLEGWKRALHSLEGACFLILDATGVGAVATKATKGSLIGARLFTRSAALARELGLARELYRPIYKTGVAIKKNPVLSRLVDHTFDQILEQRRLRKTSFAA